MSTHPFIFISGMFRSGASLLARMLNAHPELAVASEPYAPLFRAFRNQIVSSTELGQAFDHESPFGDYYFSSREQLFFDAIQNANLDRPFSIMKPFTLLEQIRQVSSKHSPRIHPYLDSISGNTYKELVEAGVRVVEEAYGDQNTAMVGIKQAWMNEFVPHILESFSEAKAIVVQRDPRAISASANHKSAGKYPWLYLARQWRKASSLGWLYTSKHFEHRSQVKLVAYDSLIRHPEKTMSEICDFLGIPSHSDVLDPGKYVDGTGDLWMQNSDYVRDVKEFKPDSLRRWKERINVRDCEFIERLCWPEMQLFGYEPVVAKNWVLPEEFISHPPLIPVSEVNEWIIPYSTATMHPYIEELQKEHQRWDELTGEKELDENRKKALCLDVNVCRELRAVARKPKAVLQAMVVDQE